MCTSYKAFVSDFGLLRNEIKINELVFKASGAEAFRLYEPNLLAFVHNKFAF